VFIEVLFDELEKIAKASDDKKSAKRRADTWRGVAEGSRGAFGTAQLGGAVGAALSPDPVTGHAIGSAIGGGIATAVGAKKGKKGLGERPKPIKGLQPALMTVGAMLGAIHAMRPSAETRTLLDQLAGRGIGVPRTTITTKRPIAAGIKGGIKGAGGGFAISKLIEFLRRRPEKD